MEKLGSSGKREEECSETYEKTASNCGFFEIFDGGVGTEKGGAD